MNLSRRNLLTTLSFLLAIAMTPLAHSADHREAPGFTMGTSKTTSTQSTMELICKGGTLSPNKKECQCPDGTKIKRTGDNKYECQPVKRH